MRCLTADAQTPLGGRASGCSFSTGTCTAAVSTVSCKLDNGTTITGSLSAAKDAISFGGGGWSKFTGQLSGLWYGPSDTQDYYVITHDAKTGNVTVWWDTTISPAGWTYSTVGSLVGMALNVDLKGYGPLTGTVSSDFAQVAWNGSAGTWHRHPQQCIAGTDGCSALSACAARSLMNNLTGPLTCPTAEEIASFETAARAGDIVWHAGPFNWQVSPSSSCQLFN